MKVKETAFPGLPPEKWPYVLEALNTGNGGDTTIAENAVRERSGRTASRARECGWRWNSRSSMDLRRGWALVKEMDKQSGPG
jgi:hypothetical protein